MSRRAYYLKAEITTTDPERMKIALIDSLGADAVIETGWGFIVRTALEGDTAAGLNRKSLLALRRVSQRTSLKSEWTKDGITEKFLDYVPWGGKS